MTDEHVVDAGTFAFPTLDDVYRSNHRFAEYVNDFTAQESIDSARFDAYTAFMQRTGFTPAFNNGQWSYNVGSGALRIVPPHYDDRGYGVRRTTDVLRSLCRVMGLPLDFVNSMLKALDDAERTCDAAMSEGNATNERPEWDDFDSPAEFYAAMEAWEGTTNNVRPVRAPEGFDDQRLDVKKEAFGKDITSARNLNMKLAKEVIAAERDAAAKEAHRASLDPDRSTSGLTYYPGCSPTPGDAPPSDWILFPSAAFRLPAVYGRKLRTLRGPQ